MQLSKDNSVYGYLSNAYGKNHCEVDKPFQSILQYFMGTVPDLSSLGSFAGRELYEVADYVDKVANPKQIMWSINGERVDEVWLAPSERLVLERLFKEFHVNRPPYRDGTWFDHYASIYLISDPGIACILTVTNQTAYALHKYGNEEQKKLIHAMIGESSFIIYGATWFTELQGGSDLGANIVEGIQEKEGSFWRLNGDTKYFASNAGLADYALVTARPKGAPPGAKGLGLFLVPKYDSTGRRNFIIRRLKEKSATISVPTGEVEFHNSEAQPVGDLHNGIYYTMEDLMVSRLSNSFGALGIARKSYLEAYYYAQKRRSFDKLLIEHPLVQRDLLDMELYLEGSLALAFKAVDQFQKSWISTPPYWDAYHYTRLLTHIAKNKTAEMASYVSKMARELHGGIGFLEEYPVERLHREALITPIWEGPSNIQALDMLEVIVKKKAHVTLLEDMRRLREGITHGRDIVDNAINRMSESLDHLSSSANEAEAQFQAKDAISILGNGIATVMLLEIGTKLGIERFLTLGQLYATRFLDDKSYPIDALKVAKSIFAIDELTKDVITNA